VISILQFWLEKHLGELAQFKIKLQFGTGCCKELEGHEEASNIANNGRLL
jgi:hypothetical protein